MVQPLDTRRYAGDAPGNAPYGYGSTPQMRLLGQKVFTGADSSIAGSAAGRGWLASLPQNPETQGTTPMPTTVLQGSLRLGAPSVAGRAGGYNPRAGRTGTNYGQQNGSLGALTKPVRGGTTAFPFPGGQGNGVIPKPGAAGSNQAIGGLAGTGQASTGQAATGQSPLFSNLANVSTSIKPEPIYSPWMTSAAVNNAVADQAGNPEYLMKATDRPGRSRDAGTMSVAMPAVAQADVGARMAKAGIPLDDYFANQNNILRGQLGRDREALGWGNLGARLAGGQIDFDNAQGAIDDSRLGMILQMLGMGG